MASDVAVCLFAVERLGGIAATDVEHLVVATANPHRPRCCGYPKCAHLDAVYCRKLNTNAGTQVGANRSIKKVAQEQLISIEIGFWQRGQIPVQADWISVVVDADD